MFAVALAPVFVLRRWMRYRKNLKALAKLDDRMLRDIGLTRSAVERAAWKCAR